MSDLERIVRCAIHPALGVARLGNAPVPEPPERWDEGFYIAPEIPGQPARPKDGFKTPEGKIKREAARFRISVTSACRTSSISACSRPA